MSKTIQVRDVPDNVHGALKARAARHGMSLSGFVKKELQHLASRPTMREWLERLEQAKPIPIKKGAARIIRGMRDER